MLFLTIATIAAIAYLCTTVYTAVKSYVGAKSKTKAKEKSEVITANPDDDKDNTYYHVTSLDSATSIIGTGLLYGSKWEGGHVYAWRKLPNQYAAENSGAHLGVIISFETDAVFVADTGISNSKVLRYGPVVSIRPGPIKVKNVRIVRIINENKRFWD